MLHRLAAISGRIDEFEETQNAVVPLLLDAVANQNASARGYERRVLAIEEAEAELRRTVATQSDLVLGFERRVLAIEEAEAERRRAAATQSDLVQGFERRVLAIEETDVELWAATHDGAQENQRLAQRLEFIREELMFEIRYGGGRVAAISDRRGGFHAGQSAYVFPEPVRLNLGCGHVPLDEFVNVDGRRLPGVDVVADVRDLPFGLASVDEIFSAHLVEHFPEEEFRRVVLPHWLDLLKPGGLLRATLPDAEAMIAATAAGVIPFDDLARVTFGAQDYDGDFHFAMYTPARFVTVLEEAGVTEVTVVEVARKNGICFEFEIAGSKAG